MPVMARAGQNPEIRQTKQVVKLHNQSLEIHLAWPEKRTDSNVFALYSSGDGGWFGAAVKIFESIAKEGMPVAGISSRSYLKVLGNSVSPVNELDLESDFLQIAQESRIGLGLPADAKVILAGWSRGAAFSVLVGSEPEFKSQCAGVIAIGLPNKEELKIHKHGKRIFIANFHPRSETILFETYERIQEIYPLPMSLIQSTHDDFFPAEDAHRLFGDESACKKFFAVPANNHRFSGGWQEFKERLKESLEWMNPTNPDLHLSSERR